MNRVIIIGAGGVGKVVARKCAMNKEVFSEIWLASRTLAKCEAIQKEIDQACNVNIQIAQVDADDVSQVATLLTQIQPDLLINVALPYQDLSLMEACLQARVSYLDTANYEPRDIPKFEYSWQWKYNDRFKERGLMAVLGAGFDPGATNAFCAYGKKHFFDQLQTIDILDCNGGDHGKAFATNFNPEINIREVTQAVRHWSSGRWIETPPILAKNSIHFTFDYPQVGPRESYLLYHEEMESLVKHIPGLERVRFWMTFSENYLNHLRVLNDVGMLGISPVKYEGKEIVPLLFLKALLPDPASLASIYKGKTVIGCILKGKKKGKFVSKYIYNVCDHEACFREVGSQAISYTTGVPVVTAAMMMLNKAWDGAGVFNIEQLDPDPFLDELARQGLPWQVEDFSGFLTA